MVPRAIFVLLLCWAGVTAANEAAQELQRATVGIEVNGRIIGSGVVVIRDFEGTPHSLIWTAGHVVSDLACDEYWDTCYAVTLVGEPRRSRVRVVACDTDRDLAILWPDDSDAFQHGIQFDRRAPSVGAWLLHCGCLHGDSLPGSITLGVVSYVDRLMRDGIRYDQVDMTVVGGSSGGPVCGIINGRPVVVGLVVQLFAFRHPAVSTIGLIVPARYMWQWAADRNLAWALDVSVPAPPLEYVEGLYPSTD